MIGQRRERGEGFTTLPLPVLRSRYNVAREILSILALQPLSVLPLLS